MTDRKPFEPMPVIGHFWHYGLRDRHSQAEWVLEALKHFDHKTWQLTIPGIVSRGHIISDPAVLKYITLNKHKVFTKQGYFADCTRELFGQGIVIAVEGEWLKQRNAAHTFLTADMLELLTSKVLPRHLGIIFDRMDEAAERGTSIDVSQLLVKYVFAVFGDIAWDTRWEDIQDLSDVFDHTVDGLSYRFALPGFRFWERILPYGARLRRNIGIIRESAARIVRNMREKIQAEELGEKDPSPDTGLLIRSLLQEHLSDEVIVDASVNFANAGRSTTSHSISWTIYELLRHPDYLKALVAELDDRAAIPTGQLIRDLPMLSNIVSESLRLNPSVPFEVVQSHAPGAVGLPDGTVILPGEVIYWCIWAINRSTRTFGPDAEQFKPERWELMDKKPTAYEYATFYSGPRACPGQQMARLTIAFVLAELFKRYELIPAWDSPRRLDEGIGGEMRGGLPVKVKRRVAGVAAGTDSVG